MISKGSWMSYISLLLCLVGVTVAKINVEILGKQSCCGPAGATTTFSTKRIRDCKDNAVASYPAVKACQYEHKTNVCSLFAERPTTKTPCASTRCFGLADTNEPAPPPVVVDGVDFTKIVARKECSDNEEARHTFGARGLTPQACANKVSENRHICQKFFEMRNSNGGVCRCLKIGYPCNQKTDVLVIRYKLVE
eukprot:m.108727 g.108727  ORF g.108727 m.108727 type:complete len:194 (+) comp27898_c0_seq2:103-684(+)